MRFILSRKSEFIINDTILYPLGGRGIINFIKKKKSWIKKLILDYYFCLKSGPVFLLQIFIIAPPLPPKGYRIVSLIINSDFLLKINLIYKTTDICSIFNADLSFSRNKLRWGNTHR
jgi:hypothetical protein